MLTQRQRHLKSLTLIAFFVALIAMGAFIKIPGPLVPITLQFAFVVTAALLLGPWLGMAAVGIYIAAGLIGLPVFTSGGGIFYVLKPTFGYMIGFVFAAFLAGIISRLNLKISGKLKYFQILVAALSALLPVYTIGVFYMYFISNYYIGTVISLSKAWLSGCVLFLPTDCAWCVASSLIAYRLRPFLHEPCTSKIKNSQIANNKDCPPQ